ncbi:MAG TPA: hypothetical protein VLR49_09395 [Ferruginibacter sp.]|nr:hypothetical protein [Ferruginibacter sp.]
MKAVLLISFLCISGIVMAQEATTSKVPGQTSFYAELGGPGILFSANIDRRFTKSHLGFGGRVGIGFVTGDFYDDTNGYYQPKSVVTIPIQLNYIFGKANSVHSFEVGAGATIAGKKLDIFDYGDNDTNSVFGTASFMYRRQPLDGGFSWRIGFTPIIASGYIQPSGGVSVGYNF